MDSDKLNKQIQMYRELADKDKNIDVASLMMSALDTKASNDLPAGQKRWAYLISLGAPPLGLLFAVKFYLSGKDDGTEAALICVTLTSVAILFLVLLTSSLFSGAGLSVDQVQQINPEDIRSLIE